MGILMGKKVQIPRYEVIRDTREQNGWFFEESNDCFGTTVDTLKTGDYSLRGIEKLFTIERKGKCQEFAQNITQERFANELERLDDFAHPFLFLEFSFKDVMNFPANQGIPLFLQKKIKIRPEFILSKILDYNIKHKTKIILVGTHGKDAAKALFRKMVFKYQDLIINAEVPNEKSEQVEKKKGGNT